LLPPDEIEEPAPTKEEMVGLKEEIKDLTVRRTCSDERGDGGFERGD
jgi:hypothetical protein